MYYLPQNTTPLILAALLLAACATPEERQLRKLSNASELLWAQYDNCTAQAKSTSTYLRLERVFILTREDPRSIQKMVIDRYASEQEKSDLLENRNEMSQCQQDLFAGFAEINPGFSALLARFMNEDDELVLQTIQNEVTIGQRNLIAKQRFAKRLGDWHFAAQRTVRLYTARLRRRCWYHCESLLAASLSPPSGSAMSNMASSPPASRLAVDVSRSGPTAPFTASSADKNRSHRPLAP